MNNEGILDARRPIDARCAAEAIHIPGTIQPHGMLLAVDPKDDWRVVACSTNTEVLGSSPLDRPLAETLGSAFTAATAQRLEDGELIPAAPWEGTLEHNGVRFDVGAHAHAGLVLVELEQSQPQDPGAALVAARRLQRAIAQLRESEEGLERLGFTTVRNIRALTGYERVLVYRFDEDWNGQAIAEEAVEGWPQPLLGLHFPESDIPAQARALYHLAPWRKTRSRDAVPAPMVAVPGQGPVDLSYARLRSLSPVHLQYHRNLGVDGAMSLSIMDGKRLWGLIVCHHRQPHRTTAAQRAAAAALTDAYALRIRPAMAAGFESARQAEQQRLGRLLAHMAGEDDLDAALTGGPVTVLDLFDVQGAAVVQGEAASRLGVTPPGAEVLRLAAWLRAEAPPGGAFATATLAACVPDWPHAGQASGLLAVFLDAERTDMLLWFRPEEPHQVSWGGNPNKADRGPVLPRESFARWVEERRGMARPWAPHEIEIAGLLRSAITEVILRNLRRVAGLSEQLRQSQKMEAVGQLTGGLAHDFNNLLGGITSSLELAQMRVQQGRSADIPRYLSAALSAAARAAALTHRLLSFSRRQTLNPQAVNANTLIRSMTDLITGTLGATIQVDAVAAAGLWTILCDGNQLENALLNLAINARDAMPGGGRLTIEATNVRVDDVVALGLDVPPGHYVAISVTDTGAGMTPEVAQRAFEPFFTTKPMGQGTGLGLSMVYGFAQQSGGQVRIYTEQGQGTTVRLYMPRHNGPAAEDAPLHRAVAAMTPGVLRVLVVDDEPLLRSMVCEALSDEGFVVLEAEDAPSGLARLEEQGLVDLLLTDVGLPGRMNGRQFAEAVRVRWPDMRVLFMTGYAENAALAGGVLDPVTQVLTKPFGLQALVDKVRSMTAVAS